jgi:coatomer protein complex subunit epsilon
MSALPEDVLFDARNNFHLGHYQAAISEATNARPATDAARAERDALVYRAYIEQGNPNIVLSEVKETSPPALRAIRLLAVYRAGDAAARAGAMGALNELIASPGAAADPNLCIVAAGLFCAEKDFQSALKVNQHAASLEQHAALAHTYVCMHRLDLAEKQVALMQRADDDATLTQLAGAELLVAKGAAKAQDALYVYADLSEKYGPSPPLLNNLATCNMLLGKWDDAEANLQDALAKSATDPTTLANAVVCMQHLKKAPEVVGRYVTQLRTSAPLHPWVEAYDAHERGFDRAAAQLGR